MPGLQGQPGDIAKRTRAHLGASGSALQWLTGTLLPAAYSRPRSKHTGSKPSALSSGSIASMPEIEDRFLRQSENRQRRITTNKACEIGAAY